MIREALACIRLQLIKVCLWFIYFHYAETENLDLHRWQLSKTVKGDADEEIAKYDGL